MNRYSAVVDVGRPSPEFQEFDRESASAEVRFHDFAGLSTTLRGHGFAVESPLFTCLGHQWLLRIYPGGDIASAEGMVSLHLYNMSDRDIKIRFDCSIKGARGSERFNMLPRNFGSKSAPNNTNAKCSRNFALRSKIRDSLIEGTLVIDVQMKQVEPSKTPPFIPENPSACKIIQNMFMDEKSADVVFEVGLQKRGGGARKKAKVSQITFYAHRFILQQCTTTLAELCGSGGDQSSHVVLIPDAKPDIFRHLLHYIYGGKVSDEDLKTYAKEIIDAADKYGVANLKLEAEACFVSSTTITIENMMDHLLYADAKNCALLKEAVMDFIVENDADVLEKVSFKDAPAGPTMITDILAAIVRGKKKNGNNGSSEDQFSTMRICDLRRKVHQKGLDVDGSRETLIATLTVNS
mmetsp:Transcript_13569/g.29503  ORF Transcript_13569/g.29503 Transcript_13569/m.29503 type:complete len:408 (+) Transcript_13569:38-1261(+)